MNESWAWSSWQDLAPVGMLEHCWHANTNCSWLCLDDITRTRAEPGPVFLLHLSGAAGPGEESRCKSLTSPSFLQSLNSYTNVNAGCVGQVWWC